MYCLSLTLLAETVAIVTMGSLESPKFYNIINGEKRSATKSHQVTDPRTEEPLWDVPIATPEDLEDAIVAANKAFKTWGKTTVKERQAALAKWIDVLSENATEVGELARKETGKSVGRIILGRDAGMGTDSIIRH